MDVETWFRKSMVSYPVIMNCGGEMVGKVRVGGANSDWVMGYTLFNDSI
jgi:hypothetical protein